MLSVWRDDGTGVRRDLTERFQCGIPLHGRCLVVQHADQQAEELVGFRHELFAGDSGELSNAGHAVRRNRYRGIGSRGDTEENRQNGRRVAFDERRGSAD